MIIKLGFNFFLCEYNTIPNIWYSFSSGKRLFNAFSGLKLSLRYTRYRNYPNVIVTFTSCFPLKRPFHQRGIHSGSMRSPSEKRTPLPRKTPSIPSADTTRGRCTSNDFPSGNRISPPSECPSLPVNNDLFPLGERPFSLDKSP